MSRLVRVAYAPGVDVYAMAIRHKRPTKGGGRVPLGVSSSATLNGCPAQVVLVERPTSVPGTRAQKSFGEANLGRR